MEKLIELLNEYEYSMFEDKSLATEWWDIQDGVVFEKNFCETIDDKKRDVTMNETHLISKKYGFIKRLVDNDKIDREKVGEKNKNWYDITRVNPDDDYIDSMETYDDEADLYLLMLLSIQDSPIEFLISILK